MSEEMRKKIVDFLMYLTYTFLLVMIFVTTSQISNECCDIKEAVEDQIEWLERTDRKVDYLCAAVEATSGTLKVVHDNFQHGWLPLLPNVPVKVDNFQEQ